ncbi:MAG TPA: dihydroorotase [Methanomassiliicoccales archaeon]|nr:dihydroorotase [Methanomassiliicoccales archaeon]
MDAVVSGRAWLKERLEPVDIGIDEGKIVSVRRHLAGGDARHDFNDMIILPAGIDVHTHMRDPGMTKKEDFATGTFAAVHGGVTCVFDMPNTRPPTVLREDLLEKKSIARHKAWVDYGLFGGCTEDSNLMRIVLDVVGVKVFMSSTTGAILLTEDGDIKPVLATAKKFDKVVSVHAEDQHLIVKREEKNPKDHEDARPIQAEVSAIERLAKIAEGAKVNVCHVSSKAGLDAAKSAGFTTEVTPHHLLLDISSGKTAYYKTNPPLRTKIEKDALFGEFIKGRIDMLASDHAPHSIEDKEQEFDAAPSGVPGVETMLPLMMALVKRDTISLAQLVSMSSERPSEIFGLNKGRIEVGRDADLNVFDPREVVPISKRRLHSKCGWTPYEGFDAIFPKATFLRGMMLTEDGSLVGERMGRDVVVPKPKPTA